MENAYKLFQHKSYKDTKVLKKFFTTAVVKLIRLLFIIGLCYLFLFPLIFLLVTAVQSPDSVNDPSVVWIPRALTLKSIQVAMKILDYKNSTILTAVISIASTAATLVSCSLVGYGLARFKFIGRNITFGLVVFTIIVPPQTLLMSSYLNYRFFNFGGLLAIFAPITHVNSVNLLNTVWTFILPAMFANGVRAGLFIFIFRQFFIGMPKDLEEAAEIDGCGALKTFINIIVPLAVPAIITVLLFSFIWHWNETYASAMYFIDGTKPISIMLKNLYQALMSSGYKTSDMSSQEMRTYEAAGCLLTILPPLILYIFTQRYFTESIERTGIVG